MAPGPWTQTTSVTSNVEQFARWGQLKRTFAVPETSQYTYRVRERAHQLYLERLARRESGSALEDWALAEQQIAFEDEERDRHDDPGDSGKPA